MTTQQTMQLVILLIIVGFSLVSWLFRKVQEEAERRRVREEMASRELERLRTGREPGPDVESAGQMERAQELAARRQAQLQELRRRQQERARQQQVTTQEARMGPASAPPAGNAPARTTARQGPLVWVPGSSGPTVPQRTSPTARRAPAQPQAKPQPTARPQPTTRVQPSVRATPQAKPVRKALFPEAPPPPPRPTPVRPAAEVYANRGPVPTTFDALKPQSRNEWRRAIILHEVLLPPTSVRGNHLP